MFDFRFYFEFDSALFYDFVFGVFCFVFVIALLVEYIFDSIMFPMFVFVFAYFYCLIA